MKSKWNLIKYCELENGIKNKQIIKIQILNDYYLRSLDNQIRNGINHVKTNYKADKQIITFYPSVKDPTVSFDLSLIDFCFITLQQSLKVFDSLLILMLFMYKK